MGVLNWLIEKLSINQLVKLINRTKTENGGHNGSVTKKID